MTDEQANLNLLNKVISVQSELITFLKAEVERLKASQTPTNHPWQIYPCPGQPYIPPDPGMVRQPWYQPPFIITSGTESGSLGSKDTLPPGAVQS